MIADLARIVQLTDQNKNIDKLLEGIEPFHHKKLVTAPTLVSDAFVNREQFDLRDADSMSNIELDIEPEKQDTSVSKG